jgi:hypothetical protein
MRATILSALENGINSKTPVFYNQNVYLLGNGAVAYWTGAELGKIPPIIPAPGTILNIAVVSNTVASPGVWPVGVIPVLPAKSNNPYLDTFIFQATIHLQSISGFCNTISQYPPISAPGPAVIPWTGFQVPAAVIKADTPTVAQPATPVETLPDATRQLTEREILDLEADLANEKSLLQKAGVTKEEIDRHLNMTADVPVDTAEKKVEPKENEKSGPKENKEIPKNQQNFITTNLNRGWAGKQIPWVRTIVNPAVDGPKLKKLYGENVAKAMLASMKNEQGFRGFNNNIGGYDITAGGWRFDPNYHDGFVVPPKGEGTTGLKKTFISFKTLDAFYEKTAAEFRRKGAGKVTTADQFAEFYYQKWFGGNSASEYAFKNYPNISKAKGGKYATLDDYQKFLKSTFKKVYTQILKYVK